MEHGFRACSSAGKTRGRLCFPQSRARRVPAGRPLKTAAQSSAKGQIRGPRGGAELCQCLHPLHRGVPSSKGKGQGSVCQEVREEIN